MSFEKEEQTVDIVYKDKSIIVCIKPAGIACESADRTNCMPELLARSLGNEGTYVGLVHRLDTVTEGLMLFSADQSVTGKLSQAIAERDTEKEYLAIVHGCPENPCGEMKDLLFRDSRKNKSYAVDRARKGVKEAVLSYKLLSTKESVYGTLSLVRVKLETGRTHQIRVQFASRKMPLLGDGKYGSADNYPRVALFATKLSFTHPKSGKRMEFERSPSGAPWNMFNDIT